MCRKLSTSHLFFYVFFRHRYISKSFLFRRNHMLPSPTSGAQLWMKQLSYWLLFWYLSVFFLCLALWFFISMHSTSLHSFIHSLIHFNSGKYRKSSLARRGCVNLFRYKMKSKGVEMSLHGLKWFDMTDDTFDLILRHGSCRNRVSTGSHVWHSQ